MPEFPTFADQIDQKQLFRKITATIDLSDLLALLGEHVLSGGNVGGYSVNLLDDAGESLVCEGIRLPVGHRAMESTLLKYKFPIDLPDAINECFLTRKLIRINRDNLHNYPGATENRFKLWELSDLAILPLICGDTAIGTIMVFQQAGDLEPAWFRRIEESLELFANQIRNALYHARLKDREEQSLTQKLEQEGFRAFVNQINSLTSEDLVYQMISHEFLRRFSFDVAAILMQEGDKLIIKKCTEISDKYSEALSQWTAFLTTSAYNIEAADGASPSVFLRNCHLYFHDALEIVHLPMSVKDRRVVDILKTPRTFVCMPIRSNGKPIGIFWLFSLEKPVPLANADLRTIEQLCDFVSTSIANAKLYSTINRQNIEIEQLNSQLQAQNEQLNELATRDRLTGLYNFGFFREALQTRLAECRRTEWKDPVALVIVDIDHFKHFNDTHGHQAGNLALVDIATRIRRLARQVDVVCRYGGEEFVIILPHCNLLGAQLFAERLRLAIESDPVNIETESVTITISAGCSECVPNEAANHFIERADIALYQAKESGRNCVVAAD